jgi:hypothetical protein
MKIHSIEVMTDAGRRVIQLGAPLDVDPEGEMPATFRELTELLWGAIQQVAIHADALSASVPKAEA